MHQFELCRQATADLRVIAIPSVFPPALVCLSVELSTTCQAVCLCSVRIFFEPPPAGSQRSRNKTYRRTNNAHSCTTSPLLLLLPKSTPKGDVITFSLLRQGRGGSPLVVSTPTLPGPRFLFWDSPLWQKVVCCSSCLSHLECKSQSRERSRMLEKFCLFFILS